MAITNWLNTEYTIVSVTLTEHGALEVVRRFPSKAVYSDGKKCPDRVVKVIYRADKTGIIRLAEEKVGTHTPAYTVAETIEF